VQFVYIPFDDFNGTDSFEYKANDGQLDSNVATVTITVNPIDDAPVANDDSFGGNKDVALTVAAPGVLVNDSDVEGDALTAVLDTGPSSGTVTLHADGSFTYTPNAGFTGFDTFTYLVTAGGLNSNTATVTIAISPPPLGFVVNRRDASVAVLSESLTILSVIDVGTFPTTLALSPDQQRLYVTLTRDSEVAVIDVPSLSVIETISVGTEPWGIDITPDGQFAYVSDPYDEAVYVLDLSSNTVVETITSSFLAYPHGLAITPDGSHVYVGNIYGSPENVTVIETATNTVVDAADVSALINNFGPWDVTILPDGKKAYTNDGDNGQSVFEIDTDPSSSTFNEVTGVIPIGTDANGPRGMESGETPLGVRVYAGLAESDEVVVIDPATNQIVARVDTGSSSFPWRVRLNPDGTQLFVSVRNDDEVVVFDTTTYTEIARITGFNQPADILFLPGPELPQTSALGDFVFKDLDRDGIQSSSELGINGVTVNLYVDADGDGIAEPPADTDPGQVTVPVGGSGGQRLLLSTHSDVVSPSGAPGLDSWTGGQLLEFADPNFALEPGTTNGTFSLLFDYGSFADDGSANIRGVHLVSSDITVGGGANTFDLQAGDLILATLNDETLTSANTLSVTDDDLFVFRPTTAGDYTSGTFSMLLDNPADGKRIHTISLVESDTTVGDDVVAAGTFLLSHSDPSLHNKLFSYVPTGVGAGAATSGTKTVLLDGGDIGFTDQIQGTELIETTTTIGGTTLAAGTLLLTLNHSNGSVGDNGISVDEHDVFALDVSLTTLGSGTTVAQATLLFEGADVGLDSSDEDLNGLTLFSIVGPALDLDSNDSSGTTGADFATTFTESAGPVAIADGDATLTDADSTTLDSLTVGIANPLDGSAEVLAANVASTPNITASYDSLAGTLTLSGTDTVANYEQVLKTVTYNNTALSPNVKDRIVYFIANDGTADGNVGITTVTMNTPRDGAPIATTVTANNGSGDPGCYLFEDLVPGDYFVEFELPAGFDFTLKDQGSDDDVDSDVDLAGVSPVTTLVAGLDNLSVDAGLVPPAIDIEKLVGFEVIPFHAGNLCDVLEKPQLLTMKYTGDANPTSHSQDASKVNVAGLTNDDPNVFIIASSKLDQNDSKNKVWFDGMVDLSEAFEIDAMFAGASKLSSKTFLTIFDSEGGSVLQTVEFHTSCSQPLEMLDQFGAAQLVGYVDETGAETTPPNATPNTGDADVDSLPGAYIEAGNLVVFTYVVTNPTGVPLANVVVTDDNQTPGDPLDDFNPSYVSGDTDGDGLLDQGENWLYVASTPAVVGQFTNIGDAVGTPVDDLGGPIAGTGVVTDQDPGNWTVVGDFLPGIDIEKATNGEDADTETGPILTVGDIVANTFVVTNTGNVPLANVAVTDDNGTPLNFLDDFSPAYTGGDTNANDLLDLDETWTYLAARTVFAGQHRNDSMVVGEDPEGAAASDADPSHYFGVQDGPAIEIEKFTRGALNAGTQGNLCDALGKPQVLTMLYTGDDDQVISHSQDPSKVQVVGDPADDPEVFILASSKQDQNDSKNKVWFEGTVDLNTTFAIDAAYAGSNKLSSTTYVQIFASQGGTLLQTVLFHTSCSQPLELENQFGAVKLESFMDEFGNGATQADPGDPGTDDPEINVGDTVIWTYVVTNLGSEPLNTVTIVDDAGTPGTTPPATDDDFSPDPILDGGFNIGDTNQNGILDSVEQWLYQDNAIVEVGQYTNLATVTASSTVSNTNVTDNDSSSHTGILAPIDVCADGKPQVLSLRYTGDGDDATSHSQDSSKVEVIGDPNDAADVFIVASNKLNLNDKKAKIWFEGMVDLNDIFAIDAALANDNHFSAATFVQIFIDNTMGTLLQSIEFHTSCSQPLSTLDQFGGVQVVGFISENGGSGGLLPTAYTSSSGNYSALGVAASYLSGANETIRVDIDINPGNANNRINLNSKGLIKVAILSSATFDATAIDPLTVSLAGAAVKLKGNGDPMANEKDVDGDGLDDLVPQLAIDDPPGIEFTQLC
jgi:uncharacterized repeat protein (TIGR01451 family)